MSSKILEKKWNQVKPAHEHHNCPKCNTANEPKTDSEDIDLDKVEKDLLEVIRVIEAMSPKQRKDLLGITKSWLEVFNQQSYLVKLEAYVRDDANRKSLREKHENSSAKEVRSEYTKTAIKFSPMYCQIIASTEELDQLDKETRGRYLYFLQQRVKDLLVYNEKKYDGYLGYLQNSG